MKYELKPRILVFGVGGAGGNAVDNMIEANLQGVEFIAANTDAQALSRSKADTRIQLGPVTTSGLGAGARPEIGEKAAEESIDEIKQHLEGAHSPHAASAEDDRSAQCRPRLSRPGQPAELQGA
jgi:cell division protein FtsZ